MRHDWHKINLACPKDDGELTIKSFSCSADGEILIDLSCKSCGVQLVYITTCAKLVLKAIEMDFLDYKAQEFKPVQPPLKPKQLTAQSDNDFLSELGIEGGL